MSEEATLDDFAHQEERDEQRQKWRNTQLHEVAYKRSDNVDPQEVELDRHVGLEHIDSNDPVPDWEPLDGLSSTKRRFEAGDILFAKLRPNLEKSAQPDFDGVSSTDIFPIVAESNINSKWLLYRLSSKPAYDYARRTSAGTRMPRTSWNLFSNFTFDLPPLPEQRKVATILYTVDQAIAKTEELASQTERVKTGLTQDLLKSGINNQKMVETNSRFGLLPKSWELRPLKEVSEVAGRTAPEKDDTECWDGDIPWATPSDITSLVGQTIDDTEEHLTELALEKVSSNLLPPMSVLMTTRATIGECAVNTVEMTTNQGFKNIIPDEKLDTWYAYYRLDYERDFLASLSKGSTFPEVGKDTVENFMVPIPPIGEQREIGKLLRSVDQQILSYKKSKSQYERLKRGLMQDLLSGTVRTTNTNIEVPEEIARYG